MIGWGGGVMLGECDHNFVAYSSSTTRLDPKVLHFIYN